jgi:hypothetical protein
MIRNPFAVTVGEMLPPFYEIPQIMERYFIFPEIHPLKLNLKFCLFPIF